MAFGDSSRHPKWPKVADAMIEAGVRTREVVRQPHRRLPMLQRLLVNPAPGIMRDTPLVHPHVTREGTETPKSGQRSPRVRWHRLALLLHVVASVGPGTTAAHGCAGVSPRTHGHGQPQGENLHSSAGTRHLSLVFFFHEPLAVRSLSPVRFPHEERAGERLFMQWTTPAGVMLRRRPQRKTSTRCRTGATMTRSRSG